MTGIYSITGNELSVGRLGPCQIICEEVLEMSARHILISSRGEKEYLSMIGRNGGYLNGRFLTRGEVSDLCYGDEIELFGIRILWLYECVVIDSDRNITVNLDKLYFTESEVVDDVDFKLINSEKSQYFSKVPRPRYAINNESIELDAPPQKQTMAEQPMLMTIGPAFTMSIPMILGFFISKMASKGTGAVSSAFMYTGIVTATGSTVLGIIFAVMNIRTRRKNAALYEERRIQSYKEYVKRSEYKIRDRYNNNVSTLRMMYPEISEYIHGSFNRYLLWNKSPLDDDYLVVRLGTGEASFEMNINIPKDKYSLVEDELRYLPSKLRQKYLTMKDVPITVDISGHRCIGIISESLSAREEMFYEIITSLAVCVAPNEVKIACIFDNNKISREAVCRIRFLPHLSYHNKLLISYDTLTSQKISTINELISEDTYEKLIIFTDCYEKLKQKLQLNEKSHIFVVENRFENLPSECRYIIQKDIEFSGYIQMTDNRFLRKSVCYDKIDLASVTSSARALQSIKIKERKSRFNMPDKISFYQIFGKKIVAGDIVRFWNTNHTIDSIRIPVGISEDGEILYIDLHEKGIGPHGLIAGTTGSGKSEVLQTIILSLAVMFSPMEIGLFLIDYKGGGMASLFEKLPHVMGSISNLSGRTIKRAMVSVKGENERRQRIFSNIGVNNINEYQKLYQRGEADEPLPHVFIIIDEFAELKREEPEFMSGLISVARVGRSLGIHLILATQKPSGVVDDNISSNSRFRICLRVLDKSDSMEMLHRPDAAGLTRPGQGILQVGNDEIFVNFQGAYTMDEAEGVIRDGRVIITDELGNELARREKQIKPERGIPQLKRVMAEIENASGSFKTEPVHPLWLKPLDDYIPMGITNDNVLHDRNNGPKPVKESSFDIAIGIYDDPSVQTQGELVINIVNTGHFIILGTLQSGKSTLLSTISYALLNLAKNDLVLMYFIDFSRGMLRPYRNFCLTGGYISEEEAEDVEKLFILLSKIMNERKKIMDGGNFRQYSITKRNDMPALFIVIDGIGAFREKTGGMYDQELEHILKNGESLGVFVIASANAISSQELPRRMADSFKAVIPLQLKDKYEYKEALSVGTLDFSMPETVRGRGLYVNNDRVVEFQCYQPVFAEDDYERNRNLEDRVKIINKELVEKHSVDKLNELVRKVPKIPDPLTFESLIREVEHRNENKDLIKAGIPIGFYLNSGEICYIPYAENLYVVITGRNGSGKNNLMRVIENMKNYISEKLDKSSYVNKVDSVEIVDYDEKLSFDALSEIKKKAGDDPYVIHLGGALDRQNFADYSYIPYSKQTGVLPAGRGMIRKTCRGFEHGEIVIPKV